MVGASVLQDVVVYLGVWLGEGPGDADRVVTHLALRHQDLGSGRNCRRESFVGRNMLKYVSAEASTSNLIYFNLSNSDSFFYKYHFHLRNIYFATSSVSRQKHSKSKNNLKLC